MIGVGRKPDYCSKAHIHMAMIKTGTSRTIDPTGYLRKRKMPTPKWVQECDHFVLVWKVGSHKLSYMPGLTRCCFQVHSDGSSFYPYPDNFINLTMFYVLICHYNTPQIVKVFQICGGKQHDVLSLGTSLRRSGQVRT